MPDFYRDDLCDDTLEVPGDTRDGVTIWQDRCRGKLAVADGITAPCGIYCWSTMNRASPLECVTDNTGGTWGFITCGEASLATGSTRTKPLMAGEYFATSLGAKLRIDPGSMVFCVQHSGFLGIPLVGGPIEPRGRLRYIDGCSDTLLVSPPRRGDPCLNHLHFPPGVKQTRHVHPSLRAGTIARGTGWCVTPAGSVELRPGTVFLISPDAEHAFETADQSMDVIAFHPDSDCGPEDEDHPMINRTLVGGRAIDNSRPEHAEADIIRGHQGLG